MLTLPGELVATQKGKAKGESTETRDRQEPSCARLSLVGLTRSHEDFSIQQSEYLGIYNRPLHLIRLSFLCH
ncbi:hypothetical protein FGIG_06866 [Fasciola gigantica]|uniref:Uncharacterized protein n=1 Tax=Fasciola gigantica TaxID=46835 RepID=A0A504XNR1_FASGI|nr:hypothetical protein FGIG_06866 [Fasciola gigantica]